MSRKEVTPSLEVRRELTGEKMKCSIKQTEETAGSGMRGNVGKSGR